MYDFNESIINSSLNINVLSQNQTASKGQDIYKIVSNSEYDILFSSSFDYKKELEKGTIKIKFQYDKYPVDANFTEFVANNGHKYYKITLNEYLERFLDKRFIDFEIVEDNNSGLKIPLTSIVDKNCFKIEKKYLRTDDEGNDAFFITNIDGSIDVVASNICKSDFDYYYVSIDDRVGGLSLNMVLLAEDGSKFIIEDIEKLSGVYNINKGYAIFKNVEIVDKTNEYTIINKNTSRGITIYDRIVLNADKVSEGDLIS